MFTPETESDIAETVKEVLEKLLALMEVDDSVVSQGQPQDAAVTEDVAVIAFDISGADPGILIGRRGQTLDSLQFLVRLIVSHQTGVWVPVVIDVEGYKQRRSQSLQVFARNMAEQVKDKGEPFTLEPMPAYERRIVHLALADHPGVDTQSTGQGESRRVVILPEEQ